VLVEIGVVVVVFVLLQSPDSLSAKGPWIARASNNPINSKPFF
jgi:hypothetical protein